MQNKFYCPDLSDKRIFYAKNHLQKIGYEYVDNVDKANFILLGVNPDRNLLSYNIPVFAGNINGDNIYDYTKNETFAIENAFLTAEGAISLIIDSSDKSLINSNVLILGYGRIGKALERLLSNFTSNIKVGARNKEQLTLAKCNNSKVCNISNAINNNYDYDFIINTIPHPILNEFELKRMSKDILIVDLASFPGGVDKHFAKVNNIKLIIARGLPAKYSPLDAGVVVAQTVDNMIREEIM